MPRFWSYAWSSLCNGSYTESHKRGAITRTSARSIRRRFTNNELQTRFEGSQTMFFTREHSAHTPHVLLPRSVSTNEGFFWWPDTWRYIAILVQSPRAEDTHSVAIEPRSISLSLGSQSDCGTDRYGRPRTNQEEINLNVIQIHILLICIRNIPCKRTKTVWTPIATDRG